MADSGVRAGPGAHPPGDDSLLLLARPADAGAAAYCRHHLSPGDGTDPAPVLLLTDRPEADRFPRRDRDDRRGLVVALGPFGGSGAVGPTEPSPPASPMATVSAAGDLGSVGRTVDDHLTAWAASGHRPVVCVETLTGLLTGASMRAVYRFLYVLVRRTGGIGGTIHVHATPRDHEEEIITTFHALFDRVVSFQDGRSVR